MLAFTSKISIYAKKIFESLLIVYRFTYLFFMTYQNRKLKQLKIKINSYFEYIVRQTSYHQMLLACGPTLVTVIIFGA